MSFVNKVQRSSILFYKLSKIRSDKFEWNDFTTIRDPHTILKYCQDNLNFIHKGSSRAAFILTGRFVLKVALNLAGQEQNKQEYNVYQETKFKNLITKVYDHDSKFYWIVVDLVKPLSHAGETNYDSMFTINHGVVHKSDYLKPDQLQSLKEFIAEQGDDFNASEVQRVGQWGKTADGRFVLLDYGLNDDVYRNYTSKLSKWETQLVLKCKSGEATQEEFNKYILSDDFAGRITDYPNKYFNKDLYKLVKNKNDYMSRQIRDRIIIQLHPRDIDYTEQDLNKLNYLFTLPYGFFTNEQVQLDHIIENPIHIKYIKNPTEATQKAAVTKQVDLLKFIDNPAMSVQLYAASQPRFRFDLIQNPSEEVQIVGVTHNPWLIGELHNPSEAVQLAALEASMGEFGAGEDEYGRTVIDYIEHPSPRVIEHYRKLIYA